MNHAVAITTLLSVVLISGCATTPASEDPVLVKLTEIEDRLDRIERVTANDSLVQMASQIDEMQSELRQLRGEVETLRFEDQSAADRQRDQYLDLDRRLQGLEQGGGVSMSTGATSGAAVAAGAGATTGAAAPAGSERSRYEAAFELLKEGRYEEARTAFQQYLVDYPNSDLAGHSQYWLGETYYVSQDYNGGAACLP